MMRTYLSVVLLLALAVQFAPLSLMHSHEDHGHAEIAHEAISSHDEDSFGGEYVSDTHDESSQEDCHICDIQQSLNNQSYTPSNQTAITNFGIRVIEFSGVQASDENYLIESLSGRAPPRA
ncbi:MAG: hypothetical protein P8P74_08590 [Crocinitomicaceae bacterium]|nr:hypothetical protein [Crocinitomicaceae bacterium]